MFLKRNPVNIAPDLSVELRDSEHWEPALLRTLNYPVDVSCFAFNPISSLLAVGTNHGTIHIYGDQAVEVALGIAEGPAIRFLQFGIKTHMLICIDGTNRLHVWDLMNYGTPKHISSAKYDPVSFLTLSPSHSHAFVALYSGDIKTYDLGCLRKSFYVIPNLWERHERKLAASHRRSTGEESKMPVEVLVHPRDLNILFIAYSGGVVMYNIAEQATLRVYELLIPPGAPGGKGYDDKELMCDRHPLVTSVAIHPAGHFFAVGYSDGCIAFWAVEDEDAPLLVRTLDDVDVNLVNGPHLEAYLAQQKSSSRPISREPVFKLSWSVLNSSSDPRGGDTVLVVLGGRLAEQAGGLSTILLRAFNPPEPPSDALAPPHMLHPFFKAAMRNSLQPLQDYQYDVLGVIHDYLLAPSSSPHFSGCADPVGILILAETADRARVVHAYQFPPPKFVAAESRTPQRAPSDTVEQLQVALEEMLLHDDAQFISLPSSLCNGTSGLNLGSLITIEKDAYHNLIDVTQAHSFPSLALKGGVAIPEGQEAALRHTKYQPRRILLTCHLDLSVHFFDASAQLVAYTPPTPLTSGFPRHIPELSVDVLAILTDAEVVKRIPPSSLDHQSIASVLLAKESLEVAIALRTGELIVLRVHPQSSPSQHVGQDGELVVLGHIPQGIGRRYAPYFMLAPGRGPLQAYALSDIGFLAASYPDGSFIVVDMRGPTVLYRYGMDDKTSKRHSIGIPLHRSHVPDPIASFNWTVCCISQDPILKVRLIAVHVSGHTQVFTIERLGSGGSGWSVGSEPTQVEGVPSPFPQGTFVIESKKGHALVANRERLIAAMQRTPLPEAEPLLVIAGSKGAKGILSLTGERVGRVEWGGKVGSVLAVQIIEKTGSHALVAFTDRQTVLCYSLPYLDHIHSLQIPSLYSIPPAIDETGDFILWKAHPKSRRIEHATYGTLFNFRRAYDPPNIELLTLNPPVPSQPQPVPMGPTSLLGSWLTFNSGLTGDRIDEILGGPDRPLYVPKGTAEPTRLPDSAGPATVTGIAAAAANVQNTLYGRLTSALNERGQMLGDLEQRLGALEEGSKGMVAEAKKLAAQQTARAWFKF